MGDWLRAMSGRRWWRRSESRSLVWIVTFGGECADGNRLGYQCSICERRRFLGSLYDQLEDKSRILLKKKVVEIRHVGDEVVVKCQDGSEFQGDLVVGADGIHSRTRVEMQRFAEETGPRGLMDRDKSSKLIKKYSSCWVSPAYMSSLSEQVEQVLVCRSPKFIRTEKASNPEHSRPGVETN